MIISDMNKKLSEVISNVCGRFTTLVLRQGKGKESRSYCARIQGVTSKNIMFEDVNTGRSHRAPFAAVLTLGTGSTRYSA